MSSFILLLKITLSKQKENAISWLCNVDIKFIYAAVCFVFKLAVSALVKIYFVSTWRVIFLRKIVSKECSFANEESKEGHEIGP